MVEEPKTQYVVLPDSTNPYLLARVQWPHVSQAISAGRPEWQSDLGLFDLPYDPNSEKVTLSQATAIATAWGAGIPPDGVQAPGPVFIRRMPANWSDLSPAEKRAWSLEFIATNPRPKGVPAPLPARSRRLIRTLSGEAKAKSPQAAPAADRRRHTRVQVAAKAQIRCGQRSVAVDLVDASEGGIQLLLAEAESILQLGSKLDSPVFLGDRADAAPISLDIEATVAWRVDTEGVTRLGVRFDDLDQRKAERVQDLVASLGVERQP